MPYNEIIHWLQTQSEQIDVAIVVEARIVHAMEHTTGEFHVMHSPAKYAGVMILIHKQVANRNCIGWREIEPGI